jgi:HlyD family secretion protein
MSKKTIYIIVGGVIVVIGSLIALSKAGVIGKRSRN